MKKRLGELPVRTNAAEQQKGRPLFWSAHRRDTERLAADQDRSNVDAIFSRTVVHGRKLQGTDAMPRPCALLIEDIGPGGRHFGTVTRVA
jgi:hypothetical protein